MALPKETIGTGAESRCTCGEKLPFRVCSSAAGYYIGTWCVLCGPNTRESEYFASYPDADKALKSGDYGRRNLAVPEMKQILAVQTAWMDSVEEVVNVLKTRFPNLTAQEVIKLAHDVTLPVYKRIVEIL